MTAAKSSGLLLLFACICCCWAVTCTLGPVGADFSTVQAAVTGCRSGSDANVLINIAVGVYPCAGLIFPTDVRNITLQGVQGNYSVVKLEGVSWNTNSNLSWPAIGLEWLTLDMGNSNTSLFDPPLNANNLTLNYVQFRHFTGPYLIQQESCTDNTTFTMTNSIFYQIDGGALMLQGLHSFYMVNNTYAYSGTNVEQAFL
jgi:pectin methylesterase-like acyl-CoA thioesterase